jgi:hypothetical protein
VGGGPKKDPESRASAAKALGARIARLVGDEADSVDEVDPEFRGPCEQSRHVSFRLIVSESEVESGGSVVVRASLGGPPRLVQNGVEIASLSDQDATQVAACLDLGYRFVGRVELLDPLRMEGIAVVKGEWGGSASSR